MGILATHYKKENITNYALHKLGSKIYVFTMLKVSFKFEPSMEIYLKTIKMMF